MATGKIEVEKFSHSITPKPLKIDGNPEFIDARVNANSVFDGSENLELLIEKLIDRSSKVTGKPIILSISVLDKNENSNSKLILKQNFGILPVQYNFVTDIPAALYDLKNFQLILANHFSQDSKIASKNLGDVYENLIERLIDPELEETEIFSKSIKSFNNSLLKAKYKNMSNEFLKCVGKLDYDEIKSYYLSKSPKHTLNKLLYLSEHEYQNRKTILSGQITFALILRIAQAWSEYEKGAKISDIRAQELLSSISFLQTESKPFFKTLSELILTGNKSDTAYQGYLDALNSFSMVARNFVNYKSSGQQSRD